MYTIESLKSQLKDFNPTGLSITTVSKLTTITLNTDKALPDAILQKVFPNAKIEFDSTDFLDGIGGSEPIEWPVYQYIIKIQG